MKKTKLISLITTLPIGVITPIVISSCSGAESKLSTVQYGDDFTVVNGEHDTAKFQANKHMLVVNQQGSTSLEIFTNTILPYVNSYWDAKSGNAEEVSPHSFYWEIMYNVGKQAKYFELKNWKTTKVTNSDVTKISFSYHFGKLDGSEVKLESWVDIAEEALPTYTPNDQGIIEVKFSSNELTFASHSFELLTIA